MCLLTSCVYTNCEQNTTTAFSSSFLGILLARNDLYLLSDEAWIKQPYTDRTKIVQNNKVLVHTCDKSSSSLFNHWFFWLIRRTGNSYFCTLNWAVGSWQFQSDPNSSYQLCNSQFRRADKATGVLVRSNSVRFPRNPKKMENRLIKLLLTTLDQIANAWKLQRPLWLG